MTEIPHSNVSPDVVRQQEEFSLPPESSRRDGTEDGRSFYGFLTGDTTVDFFHGSKYTHERDQDNYFAGFTSGIHMLLRDRFTTRGLPQNEVDYRAANITRALFAYHKKLELSLVGQASPVEIAQCAKAAYGALGENGLLNFPPHPQNT